MSIQTPTPSDYLTLARDDFAVYCGLVESRFESFAHVNRMIEDLEAVERGKIDRAINSLPPRHGKTIVNSKLYPAWVLGKHPDWSIISCSYSQELSNDYGRAVRGYLTDPLHLAVFPESRISEDNAAVHRLGTTAGGAYYAVGAGGPIVGRGANLIILDDVLKDREAAYSSAARQSLRSWYESTLYTRLAPGGRLVVAGTRWHQDDLVGWLLREHAREGWNVLSLPAIAESNDPLGRAEGAALWPERFPLPVLERIREAIGSNAWLALYQCRPVAAEGAIFKREHFRSYSGQPEFDRCVFSLDTAFKTGQSNDYSVIQVWGMTKTGYALLHVVRERLQFPLLLSRTIAAAAYWKPEALLVEDAASGQSLIQALRSETRLSVLAIKPGGDKVSRANSVAPMVESGRVLLPDSAPWLPDFLDEICGFPASPHDDMVDAMSQGLGWLRENTGAWIAWTPSSAYQGATQARSIFDSGSGGAPDYLFCTGEQMANYEDQRDAAARLRRYSNSKYRGWGPDR